MDIKPLFPITFDLKKYLKLDFQENAELYWMIVEIVAYIVAGALVAAVMGVLWHFIGFLGILFGIVDTVVGLYGLIGIVLSVLKFCKVVQ